MEVLFVCDESSRVPSTIAFTKGVIKLSKESVTVLATMTVRCD